MRYLDAIICGSLLVLSSCDGEQDQRLTITGSSTLAPVISELAAQYEQSRPGVRIDVQSGGSSRGVRDVRQGLADAGMVSRALAENEGDLSTHLLAYDGIALIVHRENPIRSLSKQQIVDIYQGTIDNWRKVGGMDSPIRVINKASGRGTLEVFLKYFEIDNEKVRADLVAGENQQVIQTVAANRDAIGYVSIGTAEYEAGRGTAIRLLPLDGVSASTASLRAGDYPLRRELNVITRGGPDSGLKAFMAFWRTPAAAKIIKSHYFVPPSA